MFPVGKSGDRQRAVWHGARVSKAAAPSPFPTHLASPSVFAYIDLGASRNLRVTKRDCRTWFDQLVLPRDLRTFMARPRVTRAELRAAGASDDEHNTYLESRERVYCGR